MSRFIENEKRKARRMVEECRWASYCRKELAKLAIDAADDTDKIWLAVLLFVMEGSENTNSI